MKTVVISCLILCSFGSWSQTIKSDYQLLWEIKGKNNKKPSYLFGSMHSNDVRLFNFPDSLYSAFVKADAVVLETDVASISDQYDVRLNVFQLDIFDSKRSFNSSKEASTTVYGDEDGRPQFLDAYFQQTAYCAGKAFYPLETIEEQLNAVEKINLSNPRAAINSYFFSKETFMQTYLQGDIMGLSKMLQHQLNGMPGAYDALITNRNKKMVIGLDTLMRKGSVFCAIGSGHLYGNDGVVQLLRAKGYSVRQVGATYTDQLTADKIKMQSWRRYELMNENYHFSIQLSGKPIVTETTDQYAFIYQELGQGNTFELNVHKEPFSLEEQYNKFITNTSVQPIDTTDIDGVRTIEGLINDPVKGYQWKRFIQINDWTYELTCYGGNKFMHSDRPKKYFDRLLINR